LDIIHEPEKRNKDIRSSFSSKVTSKEEFEVCQIDDPLLYGLGLKQIHRILPMNSEEMRIN